MKTKKRTYVILLASLLVSLGLLCFGVKNIHTAYAEEAMSIESTATTENTEATKEPSAAEIVATNYNEKIKAWIDTILGSAGIALDTLLIAVLSKKNKQSVAVTVNDSTTQGKLDTLQTNYDCLKQLIVDMFQLTKGTFDVLLTLYSNNKSLDENIRGAIKSISLNSEDIIKDFSDIVGADKHKAVKTTLQNISNIVLG